MQITAADMLNAGLLENAFKNKYNLMKQVDPNWKVVHGFCCCLNKGPGEKVLQQKVSAELPTVHRVVSVAACHQGLQSILASHLFKMNSSETQEFVKEVTSEVGLLAGGQQPEMRGWMEDDWLKTIRSSLKYFVRTAAGDPPTLCVGEEAYKILFKALEARHAKKEKINRKDCDVFLAFRFLLDAETQSKVVLSCRNMAAAGEIDIDTKATPVKRRKKGVASSSAEVSVDAVAALDRRVEDFFA